MGTSLSILDADDKSIHYPIDSIYQEMHAWHVGIQAFQGPKDYDFL